MSTLSINRSIFSDLKLNKPTRAKMWMLVGCAILALAAVGSFKYADLRDDLLDRWNIVLMEYGFQRPVVEIEVANPVFVMSIVDWAMMKNDGLGSTSKELLTKYVTIAFAESSNYQVDPFLTLAVMAVESRFDFMAQSGSGAKGLMQIIPYWHKEKITIAEVYDPSANIKAGTRILREYLDNNGGNVNRALLNYNGSLGLPGANYDNKVLKARNELQRFVEKRFIENFKQNHARRA